MAEMYKVKLTVLKTAIYPELAEKYLSIGKELKPCGGFKEGQEIIVDAFMNCPEGFCAQAWAALYPQMLTISRGGSYAPWTKEDLSLIHISCSSGCEAEADTGYRHSK